MHRHFVLPAPKGRIKKRMRGIAAHRLCAAVWHPAAAVASKRTVLATRPLLSRQPPPPSGGDGSEAKKIFVYLKSDSNFRPL